MTGPAPAALTRRSGRAANLREAADTLLRRREASVLIVAAALTGYFQVTAPAFLTQANLVTLSQFTAATAIIAAGEVMLLVSGEIDLSAGMVFALVPFIMHFLTNNRVPLIPAILVGLFVAGAIGAVNAAFTLGLGVPSFIATLGTLFAINGITLVTSHGYPSELDQNSTLAQSLGAGQWSEILWAAVIIALLQAVLTQTRWGVHSLAAGGNIVGASEAGVRVKRVKTWNFMLTSVLAGFAGVLEAFRIGSIDPLAGGTDLMFFAVASAVIGGTALAGGSGTVFGALVGAIVLGVLKDGFTLSGINAYTFDLVLGVAVLTAMTVNVRLGRWRKAGRS